MNHKIDCVVRNQGETNTDCEARNHGETKLIASFVIKNQIDREVRKGKQKLTMQFPTKGIKITINQQSHIINDQSDSSMRHGIMYKKASINLSLHTQTLRFSLGI